MFNDMSLCVTMTIIDMKPLIIIVLHFFEQVLIRISGLKATTAAAQYRKVNNVLLQYHFCLMNSHNYSFDGVLRVN